MGNRCIITFLAGRNNLILLPLNTLPNISISAYYFMLSSTPPLVFPLCRAQQSLWKWWWAFGGPWKSARTLKGLKPHWDIFMTLGRQKILKTHLEVRCLIWFSFLEIKFVFDNFIPVYFVLCLTLTTLPVPACQVLPHNDFNQDCLCDPSQEPGGLSAGYHMMLFTLACRCVPYGEKWSVVSGPWGLWSWLICACDCGFLWALPCLRAL